MHFQPHLASLFDMNLSSSELMFLAVTSMICASRAVFSFEPWASLARAGPDNARKLAAPTLDINASPSAHCGQAVVSCLLRHLGLNCAFELQLDGNRVVHFEQPGAWVFQPPLDEGNTELRAGAPMISGEIGFGRHGQFVPVAVKQESSVNLYGGVSLQFEFSGNAIWPKNDLGVTTFRRRRSGWESVG